MATLGEAGLIACACDLSFIIGARLRATPALRERLPGEATVPTLASSCAAAVDKRHVHAIGPTSARLLAQRWSPLESPNDSGESNEGEPRGARHSA